MLLSLRRVLKSVPTVGSASDSSDTYTDMCVCMSVMEWDGMGWNVMSCSYVILCYATYVRMHVCVCLILYTSIHVYIYTYVCIFT